MQHVKSDIKTICTGIAASMGSILLVGGTTGKRCILPHGEVMIHQPSGGTQGVAADIEIYTREILKKRQVLYKILAKHTGKTKDKIMKNSERDFFLTAEESLKYGIVDLIL